MRRAAARRASLSRAPAEPARRTDTELARRLRSLAAQVEDVLAMRGARIALADGTAGTSGAEGTARTVSSSLRTATRGVGDGPVPGASGRVDHAAVDGSSDFAARRNGHANGQANGHANGHANGRTNGHANGRDSFDDAATADIAEDHVETWRLVEKAQTGDGEAFGLLYDRYFDMVYRFVYYRTSSATLAEDFTQETFLRALRRISTITYQGRDIGAWFVTIARNIVLDHVKSARNRLETTTGDTIEGKEHAPSTEDAVLTHLQNEQLMAAVAQLGDEQRECVTLRFVHGLSVNETASVMGKNDGAIKALQHRAVRKLADLVERP